MRANVIDGRKGEATVVDEVPKAIKGFAPDAAVNLVNADRSLAFIALSLS